MDGNIALQLKAIPSVSFSTRDLPEPDQFEAYRADAINFSEAIQSKGVRGCPASYKAWLLGPLVVKSTDAPALGQLRTPKMARRDGLDHWAIVLPRRSTLMIDLGGGELTVTAQRPVLLSCDQSYAVQRDEAEQDWVTAIIARDALPGLGLPQGLDGVAALATPMGRMLTAHLRQMASQLPSLTAADVPALRESTLALMRATLSPSADHGAAAKPHVETVLRARLRRIIRARLGSVTLTPERLGREGGISRSALYRLFEPLGGVAAVIQSERLAQARRLLEAPDERRSIQQIAEAVGFFDPSAFSRAFRRRYDTSPRDVRQAAQSSGLITVSVRTEASRGFLDLVAKMET